jgi:hypothetical protein
VPLQQQQQQQNGQLKPIKVAQQFNFVPFAQFSGLLETIDSWIFPDKDINDDNNQPWYVAGEPWADDSEPNAISFQHGLLCSASLCRGILYKLQATM